MSAVERRTFSIGPEQSRFIDSLVERGSHTSASEVVRGAIRDLQECETCIERWLYEKVLPVYEADLRVLPRPARSKRSRRGCMARVSSRAGATRRGEALVVITNQPTCKNSHPFDVSRYAARNAIEHMFCRCPDYA